LLYCLSSFYCKGQKISILLPAIMFSYSVVIVHCICSIGYTDTLLNPDTVSGSFGLADSFKLSCTATSSTITSRVGEKTSALHSPLEQLAQCACPTQPKQIVMDSSLARSVVRTDSVESTQRFTLCRPTRSMWTKGNTCFARGSCRFESNPLTTRARPLLFSARTAGFEPAQAEPI